MRVARTAIVAFGLLGIAGQSIAAQQAVPVRDLAPVDAKSSTSFGNIFGVRPLTGGKVLVNDGIRRQLTVLDADLSHPNVIIDSTAGTSNSYGPRSAPLIPYLADSSLFVDGASLSLLVIDPRGQVARVMSAPKPGDLTFLGAGASGVDNKGRLIYRAPLRMTAQQRAPQGAPGTASGLNTQTPDSAPIVRADFDTRQVDTIGRVKQQSGGRINMTTNESGKMTLKTTINPLVTVDEWAVLSEGSVAFVRGHDYHIDWLHPDGTTSSSPKLPFDWKRLTDEDKQKLIDSARTAQAESQAKAAADAKNGISTGAAGAEMGAVRAMAGAAGGGGGGGGGQMVVVVRGGDGGMGGADVGGGKPAMSMPMSFTPEIEFVPLKDIADYYPAIRMGATKADLDGNLWILPTTSAQSKAGELVYDVVSHTGDLLERVRMPVGRSIAGFGHGGIVYLMWRDANNAWYLERARIIGSKRVTQ
jgi:hypothetical protein